MFNDLIYAVRLLLNNPRFSALTIFVMTTGLALCIFMFTFINGTLTAPLPIENGERMRKITTLVDGTAYDGSTLRLHEYEDILKVQQSFEVLEVMGNRSANLNTGDKVLRYSATTVTPKFFELSQGRAQLGRLIGQDDLTQGSPNVVVLTHSLWQELFASDKEIIGKKVRINSEPHTVIGVTQPEYRFPNVASMYLPLRATTNGVAREDSPYVSVYGLLKPGVSDEVALNEVQTLFKQFAADYPKLNSNVQGYLWTLQEEAMGNGTKPIILAMQISVALILLLACINVGNLLLSRAVERNKETAIRTALGAPRGKLIAQLLWESGLICVISGVFAILIAGLALDLAMHTLLSDLPIPAPFWWQAHLSGTTILFTAVVTLITIILTGALPAWRTTSGDINAILRDGTRGAQSKATGRLSKIIVIAEVALSCILITLSGAMVNSVSQMNSADYGMDIDRYLTARVGLPGNRYETPEQRIEYYNKLVAKLEQDPNVTSVAMSQSLPSTWASYFNIAFEGVDYGKEPVYPSSNVIVVSENFFDTMNINLLQGRKFTSSDRADTQAVAVVTQDFVDNYYQGQDPIGKRFKQTEGDEKWLTIVGVINNVTFGQPFEFNLRKTDAFILYRQQPKRFMNLAIESKLDPNLLRETLDSAMVSVDRDVPAYNVMTLEKGVIQRIGGINFVSKIFLVFAIASMVLAFSGIYGVMANAIAQKTQEVGVRRALGADDVSIRRHFIVAAFKQLAFGLILGVPLGVVVVGLLEKAGMAKGSLEVYLGVPSLIAVVILVAVLLPVSRSLKIEPAYALRYE